MNDNKELELFNFIGQKLSTKEKDVSIGKMMSSPGIKYKNKVFAFYHDKEMIFKLGKGFEETNEFKDLGINDKNIKYLNPFKNKPPMKAWFVVSFDESDKWEKLAEAALNNMKE